MENIYNIAIIGAGPAGIATSCEAVELGVENVILFEKSSNHSETIRKYFKDNKPVDKVWKGIEVELQGNINFEGGTKETTLDLFENSLEKGIIEAKFHTEVDSVKKDGNVFTIYTNTNESFKTKNIVVAIGKMGKPNKPNYDIPKSLNKVINYHISDCTGGEDVLVVGGGDSAVEFAYFIHQDNNVLLNYRKEKITRANQKNIDNLLSKVDEGKVELKLGIDINSIEDENGKIKVNFADDSSKFFHRVIYALGGSTPKEFFKKCDIILDEKDKPKVDDTHLNSDGIYLAGDIAGKLGGSIASALNHGYLIVKDIKQKLK